MTLEGVLPVSLPRLSVEKVADLSLPSGFDIDRFAGVFHLLLKICMLLSALLDLSMNLRLSKIVEGRLHCVDILCRWAMDS